MQTKSKLRKGLAVGIILLFVGMSIIPSNAQNIENTSLPTSRGHWLYVGGNGPGNYTRIQDAIDNSSDGDTVFVYDDSSPYFELLYINLSIYLIGENKETTIINGINNTPPYGIINIHTDGVYISGFTIQNSGWDGVFLNQSTSNVITNNIFRNNHYGGVSSVRSARNTISYNTFKNNFYGIQLGSRTDDTIVSNNYISNNAGGIWTGEYFTATRRNHIVNNTIENNGEGILLFTNDEIIESNNISKNYRGIDADHTTGNLIIKNTIERNRVGLFFNQGGNNIIKNNNIRFNHRGILLLISSQNEIISNNFILNFKNAGGFESTNTWDQNYWNRPRLLPVPIIIWRLYWIIPPSYYHIGLAVPYPKPEFDSYPAILPN